VGRTRGVLPPEPGRKLTANQKVAGWGRWWFGNAKSGEGGPGPQGQRCPISLGVENDPVGRRGRTRSPPPPGPGSGAEGGPLRAHQRSLFRPRSLLPEAARGGDALAETVNGGKKGRSPRPEGGPAQQTGERFLGVFGAARRAKRAGEGDRGQPVSRPRVRGWGRRGKSWGPSARLGPGGPQRGPTSKTGGGLRPHQRRPGQHDRPGIRATGPAEPPGTTAAKVTVARIRTRPRVRRGQGGPQRKTSPPPGGRDPCLGAEVSKLPHAGWTRSGCRGGGTGGAAAPPVTTGRPNLPARPSSRVKPRANPARGFGGFPKPASGPPRAQRSRWSKRLAAKKSGRPFGQVRHPRGLG
jgi:hypothetical protein